MPREIRKRGKKKAKLQTPSVPEPVVKEPDTPSWMQSTKPNPLTNDLEAPFGYVEADVKAYFRTVDLRIRDWQSGTGDFDLPEDVDPNQGVVVPIVNGRCR
jgi:nucleolar protein 9